MARAKKKKRNGGPPAAVYCKAAGLFRPHPPEVDAAVRCPEHGGLLLRGEIGWLCVQCPPSARRLVDDSVLLEALCRTPEVRAAAGDEKAGWKVLRKMLRFLKLRSLWWHRTKNPRLGGPEIAPGRKTARAK